MAAAAHPAYHGLLWAFLTAGDILPHCKPTSVISFQALAGVAYFNQLAAGVAIIGIVIEIAILGHIDGMIAGCLVK